MDTSHIAIPYEWDKDENKYVAFGHNGYPDYPAGTLRCRAGELATFLATHIHRGSLASQHVLDTNSAILLAPSDYRDPHTWFEHKTKGGRQFYSHSGGDFGVLSFMAFDPSSGDGMLFLSNGGIADGKSNEKIARISEVLLRPHR